MPEGSYYLDPVLTNTPPSKGRYCCRCQIAMRFDTEGLQCTVDASGFRVSLSGPDRIHPLCWDHVRKLKQPDPPKKRGRGRPQRDTRAKSEIHAVRATLEVAKVLKSEFGSLGNALHYLYTGIAAFRAEALKKQTKAAKGK